MTPSPTDVLKKIEPGNGNHGFCELAGFIKATKDVDLDIVEKMFDGFDSSKFDQYDKWIRHERWQTRFVSQMWVVCNLLMKTPKFFPIFASHLIKVKQIEIIPHSNNPGYRIYRLKVTYPDESIDESKFFIDDRDKINEDEQLFLDSGFMKINDWFSFIPYYQINN